MEISFAGDCNFISEIYGISPEKVIQDEDLWCADKKYVNLEQAISDNNIVTDKYMIYSGAECIPYLKKMQIDGVSLANNHIHDKGTDGIIDTISILDNANIKHTGAGKNLTDASWPIKIDNNLYLLAFCDYGEKYLRNVKVASETEAGINPYSVNRVIKQLDKLSDEAQAIVYIHWSVEYSWLVPYKCIEGAKKILAHPKAKLLIGQHAHIPLGWLKFNDKFAFFSLGNFLFSNFCLYPPNIVKSSYNEKKEKPIIKIMMPVKRPVYKKWYFTNRISILVHYNTETGRVRTDYTIQDEGLPYIKKLRGIREKFINCWLHILSALYKMPNIIYNPFFRLSLYCMYGVRKIKRGMVNIFYGKISKK